MIFPIGDTQVQGGHKPYVSYTFIAINVCVFLYEFYLGPKANEFIITYGTIPNEITAGQDYFTLFTSIFLHGGWMHLIGNMLFLWVFADNIEAKIGSSRFLMFYLFGGLVASLAHVGFNMDSTIPTVGASGAIAAVMGAYLVMFPKSKIKILVIVFFRSFHIPAFLFLGLWFGQQLLSSFGSLAETKDTSGVAWWAHIGGFVVGLVAGYYFKQAMDRWHPSASAPKDYV